MPLALCCPHCASVLPDVVQQQAVRCPACRLVVGAGRAVPADRTERRAGAAAGVLSNAARRDASPVDPAVAIKGIRAVAAKEGGSPARLRLLDYQALAEPEHPEPASIIATFGSWKAACRAVAAEERAKHAAEAEVDEVQACGSSAA
jgi:hypothetical protein